MLQDELYSSRIRDFEVFGRQNHPRAEGPDYGSHLNASAWQLLGSFTAANTKGTQVLTSCLLLVSTISHDASVPLVPPRMDWSR